MEQEKSFMFMQIAMKYIPQAKEKLDEMGIELSLDNIEPMFQLLTKVMEEAYQQGYQDALKEVK